MKYTTEMLLFRKQEEEKLKEERERFPRSKRKKTVRVKPTEENLKARSVNHDGHQMEVKEKEEGGRPHRPAIQTLWLDGGHTSHGVSAQGLAKQR